MDKAAQYAKAAEFYKQALAEGADADEARAAYDAAIARIAAMPEAKPATPAAAPSETVGDFAKGATRAVGQGVTFGFGDNLEAGVRALSPDVTYKDALSNVRNEQAQFADKHPVVNFGAEVAGGLATGGALRSAAKKGLSMVAGKLVPQAIEGGVTALSNAGTRLSNSALAQGAIAGVGAGNAETLGGDVLNAGIGGVAGGILGSAIGKAGGTITEMAERARGTAAARKIGQLGDQVQSTMVNAIPSTNPVGRLADKAVGKIGALMSDTPLGERAPTLAGRRAVTALVNRMGQGKITPDVLNFAGGNVAGGMNTASGATILDNMGVVGERTARGLRTVGGEAGEMIDNFATTRQRNQVERMTDALYNGKSIDDVVQMTDDFIKERGLQSTPLYEQFRAQPPVYTPKLEDLFERPLFKKAMSKADEYQKNAGVKQAMVITPNGGTQKLYSPDYLDSVKKLLDDIIYKGKQPGEGGMGPGEMRQAKELREEFVQEVDRIVPYYKAARDAWAGPTALKGAMEDGIEAANSSVTPEALRKEFSSLSSSEQELFQRGYIDQLRQRLENGGLKPAATEQRAFLKRIDAVFGKDANLMLTRLRDEVAATRTANFLATGSQTTDKGAEAIDALVPEKSNAWAQALFNPYRAVSNVAGKALANRIPLFRNTRTETAKMLLSPQDEASVLRMLAGEFGVQDAGKKVSNSVRGPMAAETSYGFFRRPPEERK